MEGPILPEVKKEKTAEEKVEEAIVKAKEVYKRQFITTVEGAIVINGKVENIRYLDTTPSVIEIAKMILQEEK